jgi:hypothetical protein
VSAPRYWSAVPNDAQLKRWFLVPGYQPKFREKNGPQLAGLLGGMELGPLGVALGEGHRENLAIAGMFLSFPKSECVDQPHGRDLRRPREGLHDPLSPGPPGTHRVANSL